MFILAAVLCVPAPRDWSWDANGTCQGFGVHRAARGAGGGWGWQPRPGTSCSSCDTEWGLGMQESPLKPPPSVASGLIPAAGISLLLPSVQLESLSVSCPGLCQ